ncbi:hypothetical protein GALL_95510 [mine drainage metagenome]|uniref:Periplasmic protein n=1 Tax=mine drainage metagenome TaxID=410659 RepID=A0A1J5SIZ7_9ZZZZ
MKKLILLSSCIFACVCFANAQPPKNNNGNPNKPFKNGQFKQQPMQNCFTQNHPLLKKRMGMMAGLHLSADQIKQSKAINEDFHNQVAALQKNDKISLGEYKTKIAALQNDRKTKLEAMLTDAQKNTIAQRKQNAMVNAQVRSTARLERMKLTLGLSDDQVAKIKAHQTEMQTKMQAIHQNADLLPEQKREQLKSLMSQRGEFMKSVLTPEQLSKSDSLRKNFRGRWNMNNRPPVSK